MKKLDQLTTILVGSMRRIKVFMPDADLTGLHAVADLLEEEQRDDDAAAVRYTLTVELIRPIDLGVTPEGMSALQAAGEPLVSHRVHIPAKGPDALTFAWLPSGGTTLLTLASQRAGIMHAHEMSARDLSRARRVHQLDERAEAAVRAMRWMAVVWFATKNPPWMLFQRLAASLPTH